MKKIVIIGMGNMGSAVHDQLHFFDQFDVVGCNRHSDTKAELYDADIAIIAVKPQSARELFESFSGIFEHKLVLSIMAGVTLHRLSVLSGAKKVVRCMPNLGVKLGKGVTGWIACEDVSDSEKDVVKKILGVMGLEVELKTEEDIDRIAAISGSGPAYFFYLTELLTQKAVKLGFDPDMAEKIAKQTLVGSVELLLQGNKSTEEWRASVTSKGGTTQAAFVHMTNHNFDTIFFDALDAAIARAKELNA